MLANERLCLQAHKLQRPVERPEGDDAAGCSDDIHARLWVGDEEATEAAILDSTIFPLCDIVPSVITSPTVLACRPGTVEIPCGEHVKVDCGSPGVFWYGIMVAHVHSTVFEDGHEPEAAIRVQVVWLRLGRESGWPR